jgi:hypothetical protein
MGLEVILAKIAIVILIILSGAFMEPEYGCMIVTCEITSHS